MQNDDGINPCNSQDVLITDCFIRSDDDCVALKGLTFDAPNRNIERVKVVDEVLERNSARLKIGAHVNDVRVVQE